MTDTMLDISDEVWREIGCYLPLTDKAAASRVNKAWNKTFRPQMYRSLNLRKEDNNRDDDKTMERRGGFEDEDEDGDDALLKVLMPPNEAVYKHEAFIQEMRLNFPSPLLDGRTTWATRSLKKLRLDALMSSKASPKAWAVLEQLLTNSPSLDHVEMSGFKVPGILFILQRIQHIGHVTFSMCDFTGIEAAFKKSQLDLCMTTLRLELNQGIGFQSVINWIGHFRHLTGLSMNHPPDNNGDDAMAIIYPERAPKINMSALRKVVGLSTLNVEGPLLWGHQLAEMLKSCPKVTNLSLFDQTIYEDGFWAMAKLFPDLAHLSLVGCDRLLPWMVKVLLDSCPRLETLRCSNFDIEYMFDPQAYAYGAPLKAPAKKANQLWPCTGLKALVLSDVTWTSNAKQLKAFMNHVGSLKNLEVFQLAYVDREEDLLRVVLPGSVRSAGKDLKLILKDGDFTRKDLKKNASLKWVLDVWPKMKIYSIML